MDLALIYDPKLQAYDFALDGTDFLSDDTFASPVLVSLLCDRQVEDYEVKPGEDRRGFWADAYADNNHKTGSRWWLLEREKELSSVVQRCKQYSEEALQWFIDDVLAQAIVVTAFVPRRGFLAAMIRFQIHGTSRTLRVEFDESRQVWRLAGEAFSAV